MVCDNHRIYHLNYAKKHHATITSVEEGTQALWKKKTNRCYRINIRALFGSVGTIKFTPLIIINDEHRSLGKKRTSKTNETIKKVGIGLIEKIS